MMVLTGKNAFYATTWTFIPIILKSKRPRDYITNEANFNLTNGPRQANLVLIAYESREGSGEPAHPRSLVRTFAARSHKQ